MLSQDEKKKLRTIGHSLSSMMQIGKGSLSPNMITSLKNDLEAHELVKVTILKTADIEPREAAIELAAATGSEVVQIIGRTFLLYRQSKENKLGL
ncbi:YhbY family RNA-binding protein [Ileibacterium valens]|uniref:RNA-binding protein n=1 Tax=Ileibacterium valens TaxID=1862668 RepID=A0A1U7NH90_9FIRM|nr:YhbY family RNA-binding protein [Ileibacterium valens]OLU38562.1 RNA-binding protein [Erysipelotrichaceae bacterium NYU-BL-E8]OLU39882.1 RNA-binding protein [Erysipelotrichaceae bacterium NYU-BL-F16]OLU40944.1 RNA-binding protein [Ileibacterium valens]